MKKFLFLLPLFVYFMFAAQVPATQAQQPRPTPTTIPTADTGTAQTNGTAKGSIRGTVFEDTNSDNVCDGDDAGFAGISLTFTQGDYVVSTIQTGDNGTYGIVAIPFGWWDIKVTAPEGYRVVGADELSVNVEGGSHEAETVVGVNFCMTKGTTTTTTDNDQTGTWTDGDNCGVWPNGVRPENCSANSGQWYPPATTNNNQTGVWTDNDNCGVWPNGVRPTNCGGQQQTWTAPTTTGSYTPPPATTTTTGVLLPQAGGENAGTNRISLLAWLMVGATLFLGAGFSLEMRRRQQQQVVTIKE